MSISLLSKTELAALVLAEIRKHEGCEGVDSVAILETTRLHSLANWEICIIAASSGEPSVVQRAASAVEKSLQLRYQLKDGAPHQFRAGDRVRISEVGRTHARRALGAIGTVDSERSARDMVRVLFDGSKRSVHLHYSYIEPAEPK